MQNLMSGHDESKPRIPPGQEVVPGWPVLHHGRTPVIDLSRWRLRAFGLVEEEVDLAWEAFISLPLSEELADFHCVTGWSVLDLRWEGVMVADFMKLITPRPEARFVMVHAEAGWATNLPLEDFAHETAIFAIRCNGGDLPPEHGGPVRLVIPHLYAWKSAKWVTGVEFMDEDRPGFWEQRGYHMRGDPWKEERYG